MREITDEIKAELKEMVYDFFAEECEMDRDSLTATMSISDDLDGDSLLFVELIEVAKKKYDLDIQLQTVGKYLLKTAADTLGDVVEAFIKIYQYGNDVLNQ